MFGRATTSMLIPGRLRSRLIFCVMSLMAQGAHRGRPVAAAPCTPGLRPAKSPLRGTFDFSLQASGRAEAASVQNTALSPHPCGLPRPSGNVSAILRPPAPAVSATMVNKSTADRTNRRSGKRSATRQNNGASGYGAGQRGQGALCCPHPGPLPQGEGENQPYEYFFVRRVGAVFAGSSGQTCLG